MSQQRQHILLSYFKTLSVSPAGVWTYDPPGGTPLYKPSAAPKGRVFAPFQSENGDTFFTFGLESSMVFEEITGVYEQICRFNSKWIRKEE